MKTNGKLLKERIERVQNRMAISAQESGRSVADIRLIAVSKNFSVEEIRGAADLGLKSFGENYAQEAIEKLNILSDLKLNWHFIGHLQTNKIRMIVNKFDYIHSVSSIRIANEIDKRTEQIQKVLIEVNLSGEESKSGCEPSKLGELLGQIQDLQKLKICGLMFMAPFEIGENEQRIFFERAYNLREKCASKVGGRHNLSELSMGTSQDFEAAIRAGATMIRLGTTIFGERKYESK